MMSTSNTSRAYFSHGTKPVVISFHLDILGIDADCICAVLFGLEVDRHLALGFAAHHGVVSVALWDIELGAVLEELELRQLTTFVETDDSAVDDGATVLHHVEGDALTLAAGSG